MQKFGGMHQQSLNSYNSELYNWNLTIFTNIKKKHINKVLNETNLKIMILVLDASKTAKKCKKIQCDNINKHKIHQIYDHIEFFSIM